MANDDCTCPAVHVVRDTIISYVTTNDLARMKREVKEEVAEALRAGYDSLPADFVRSRVGFKVAADRLSSPPAPKVELPTMEDWKWQARCQTVSYPNPETGRRFDNLARLVAEGKARIELLP